MDEPKPEQIPEALAGLAGAMMETGEEKKKRLEKASTDLLREMETSAAQVRELIAAQPPTSLLGYLWSQMFLGFQKHRDEKGDDARPDGDVIKEFQFILEYVHAVWSGHKGEFATGELDEAKAKELIEVCRKLSNTAMFHAMASSQLGEIADFGDATSDVEFQAKSSWLLIRGHRYQVLEHEFFEFTLKPHDEALRKAYGIGADEIATDIQSIADSLRAGYSDAIFRMFGGFDACQKRMAEDGITLEEAMAKFKAEGREFAAEAGDAIKEMFYGGICNLSKHTKLPEKLLEDMAYQPGAEEAFFADGDFKGTPYRTLPARIKPLVKLSDGYYATDGQFVRDSAYRAIQRGLIARLPDYREGWNKNQKGMTETAFSTILASQLKGATLFEEVYFKDPANGQWAETDLVGLIGDVMFVVEAKAGVMAMQSPATNFQSHIRTIRELVLKAYRQCKRFLDYLASGTDMPIYRLKDGRYEEAGKINLKNLRCIYPIGLTVESFTPFSSMCKEIPEVVPILGKHPFVSMSVDDLFVLKRLLPSAGELFHYLEVRQAVAGIPQAMIFDEIDHLGAYVLRNRFDHDIQEQLKKADRVAWDTFSHVVDQYFGQLDWETAPVPSQSYPKQIAALLAFLERTRPPRWLRIDAELRNYGDLARNDINKLLGEILPTLERHHVRRILIGSGTIVQIWFSTEMGLPAPADMQRQAEIACLVAGTASATALRLQCDKDANFLVASTSNYAAPSVLRQDYGALKAEADQLRKRYKGK
jgi:hypothetical protein